MSSFPFLIAGAVCGSFRSPELTDGLPRGSDVDYAEFEANRMTAEDRAFFDENGYVRPPAVATVKSVRVSVHIGFTCRLHR